METATSWDKLTDALVGTYEDDILDGLLGAYQSLEGRIEVAYKSAQKPGASTFPLQRLLVLRKELEGQLSQMKLPDSLKAKVIKALDDGQMAADYWAAIEINKIDPGAGVLGVEITPGMAQQNPEALVAAAQRQTALRNYALWEIDPKAAQVIDLIDKHAVDLRGRIMGAVEFHLAQADSWTSLRKTLRDSFNLTKTRAQMVARTEMSSAMITGKKMRYEAEGIEYIQIIATGSDRTCGYCAPRHNYVYEMGKVTVILHPNCRCTSIPWREEWVEQGLVDPQADAQSRKEVLEDLKAAGKEPINGPAPFERSLGLDEAPEPFWKPEAGITKKSKKGSFGIDYKQIKKDIEDMQSKAAKILSGDLPSSSDSPAEVMSKVGAYKDVVKEMDDQMAKMEKDIALISIDPEPFDKKPALPSTASKLRRKKVRDVKFSYGKNIDALGYSSREEYDKAVQSLDRWIGASSSKIRAAETLQALEEGKDLSEYAKAIAEELKDAASLSGLSAKDYIQGYKDVADSIEDFIARAPVYRGEVHRGINFNSKQQADGFISRLASGAKSVATESWTAYSPVAEGFATGENAPVSGEFAVVLHVQNKRGAPVDAFNPMDESEVLIPRNSAYKVKRVSHGRTLQGMGGTTLKVMDVYLKAL